MNVEELDEKLGDLFLYDTTGHPDYDAIENLLKQGADPNAVYTLDTGHGSDDFDAINFILRRQEIPDMRLLKLYLKYGANPNDSTYQYFGTSPGYLFSLMDYGLGNDYQRTLDISKVLLDHGASPNFIVDETPILIYSIETSFGLDKKYKSGDYRREVIQNIKLGLPQFVKMLIDYGADVNAKDRAGKTALDYAREGSTKGDPQLFDTYKDIATMLEDAQRKQNLRKQINKDDFNQSFRETMERPGGLRDRARRATLKGFKTDLTSRSNLCSDLESNLYKDELYALAIDLGLPVTKRTTKKELCQMIGTYHSP